MVCVFGNKVETLSFSSMIKRSANFFPTPGAIVRVFISFCNNALTTFTGVIVDRSFNPNLGPTPETEMSWQKKCLSSEVWKPYFQDY